MSVWIISPKHKGAFPNGLCFSYTTRFTQLLHNKLIWDETYGKILDLQHQYNNCTTIPHMRVSPTYWDSPSCEELLYSCCIGVVQESNLETYVVGLTHMDPTSYECVV